MKGKYWKEEANAENAESVNRLLLEYQNWWNERALPWGPLELSTFSFGKSISTKRALSRVAIPTYARYVETKCKYLALASITQFPTTYYIRLNIKRRKKLQVPKVKDRQKSRVWIFCHIRSSNAPLARTQIQLQSLLQMNGTWQIPEMRNQTIVKFYHYNSFFKYQLLEVRCNCQPFFESCPWLVRSSLCRWYNALWHNYWRHLLFQWQVGRDGIVGGKFHIVPHLRETCCYCLRSSNTVYQVIFKADCECHSSNAYIN